MQTLSEHHCYGGIQGFYSHDSQATGTPMRFAAYLPPQAKTARVPVLYYLAGLTCTEETATIKAGAQAYAAKHGLALVMPDTSPRGAGIQREDDDWDFGSAAGFYLDATQAPWSKNYRMYSYVTGELRALVNATFPVQADAAGIFGHSMGGHGALTIGLKHPDIYRSISAFAPICAPTQCPWGENAFSNYLGEERQAWAAYDACKLIEQGARTQEILVDQGKADGFLTEQLKPECLQAVCKVAGQPLNLRLHEGYDHSYYFIATFMREHIAHHARILSA